MSIISAEVTVNGATRQFTIGGTTTTNGISDVVTALGAAQREINDHITHHVQQQQQQQQQQPPPAKKAKTSTRDDDTPVLQELSTVHTRDELFRSVSVLFEPAPPLADALWRAFESNEFAAYDELIARAKVVIDSELTQAQRLEVINAHPSLGVRPQNRAALSVLSRREQGLVVGGDGGGAAAATDVEEQMYTEMEKMNAEYEHKFGFKFVEFANGRSKAELLPVMRDRLQNARDDELRTGLHAMLSIAADRLRKLTTR